jgi:hypothetical protein
MMSPLYQGRTRNPPLPARVISDNCTIGSYSSSAINASNTRALQIGVNFARSTGIRLVVKNTGHDFVGKSGGAGSLSIWIHHLKDLDFLPEFIENEGVWVCGTCVHWFKRGS